MMDAVVKLNSRVKQKTHVHTQHAHTHTKVHPVLTFGTYSQTQEPLRCFTLVPKMTENVVVGVSQLLILAVSLKLDKME